MCEGVCVRAHTRVCACLCVLGGWVGVGSISLKTESKPREVLDTVNCKLCWRICLSMQSNTNMSILVYLCTMWLIFGDAIRVTEGMF